MVTVDTTMMGRTLTTLGAFTIAHRCPPRRADIARRNRYGTALQPHEGNETRQRLGDAAKSIPVLEFRRAD